MNLESNINKRKCLALTTLDWSLDLQKQCVLLVSKLVN